MTDDDELFRNDLRRAVATADVDDAWGTIARRVRVQRAGRTTARIGIPVLCAAALIGGVAALSNHKSGTDRPADQPTTSVAVAPTATTVVGTTSVPATSPTTASSAAPTTATTATPDTSTATTLPAVAEPLGALAGSAATPVFEQPDTWTRIGRTTSNGLSYDVASFDYGPGIQQCLSIRLPDSTRSLADVCPQPGHVTSVVVQRGMFVFLLRDDASVVTVRTSTRDYQVAGLPVGTQTAFVTVLPPPQELVQMADGPDLTACPPHEVWTAVDATGAFDGGLPSLSITKCAPSGAMEIGSESTSRILQPGGGVARRTANGVEIYAFGGTFCDMTSYPTDTPQLVAKRDGAESVCKELGILATPST